MKYILTEAEYETIRDALTEAMGYNLKLSHAAGWALHAAVKRAAAAEDVI